MLKLTHIFIYPIKSLGAIRVSEAIVETRGLQYDRRWMLVNKKGRLLTQRQIPEMTLLKPALTAEGLEISHKHQNITPLLIPLDLTSDESIEVRVWNDLVWASFVNKEADEWFSKVLGHPCRLMYMPNDSKRLVDTDYATNGEIVSLADGYPLLILGQESLNFLNQKLKHPVEMLRFRPNLVLSGGYPHIEDEWGAIQIGEVQFRGVKKCARCAIPNINPKTGKKGIEPTETLKQYRREGTKILFGQNLLIESQGLRIVKEGDEITVF